MAEKVRAGLRGAAKSLAFGTAAAAGLALVFFLFAFLTSGFDASTGLDWARKLDFLLGSLCIVVGGVGLLFSGTEYRDSRIGFAKDEVLSSFVNITGISWATALIVASVGFLAVGTAIDLLYRLSLS